MPSLRTIQAPRRNGENQQSPFHGLNIPHFSGERQGKLDLTESEWSRGKTSPYQ